MLFFFTIHFPQILKVSSAIWLSAFTHESWLPPPMIKAELDQDSSLDHCLPNVNPYGSSSRPELGTFPKFLPEVIHLPNLAKVTSERYHRLGLQPTCLTCHSPSFTSEITHLNLNLESFSTPLQDLKEIWTLVRSICHFKGNWLYVNRPYSSRYLL